MVSVRKFTKTDTKSTGLKFNAKFLNPSGSLQSPVLVSPSMLRRPAFDRARHTSHQMLLFAHVCLLLTGAGEFFTNDNLVLGLKSSNLPAPGPVSPRGFSNGSAPPENDTNLDSPGSYPSRVVSMFYPPYFNTSIQEDPLDSYQSCNELPHSSIPTGSRFEFCALVLALTFNVLGILSPGSIFLQARVCLLSLGLVVLQDRLIRTSYCSAVSRYKSRFCALFKRAPLGYVCGSMLMALFT